MNRIAAVTSGLPGDITLTAFEAVVVGPDGTILGDGWNQAIARNDPTWNDEMLAICELLRPEAVAVWWEYAALPRRGRILIPIRDRSLVRQRAGDGDRINRPVPLPPDSVRPGSRRPQGPRCFAGPGSLPRPALAGRHRLQCL